MSAVRLSFLQVTNSEVITAHSNAWHTRIAMSLLTHTLAPRHTWLNFGRRTDVHMLAVSDQTHRMFTQTPTTYIIHTFMHVIQTHAPVCPHTHCLVDVQTPFLLSSQCHWRRHAYTHKRSNKTWWKVTRYVRTSYDSQPHLIAPSIFSPDLVLCHRFISRISK